MIEKMNSEKYGVRVCCSYTFFILWNGVWTPDYSNLHFSLQRPLLLTIHIDRNIICVTIFMLDNMFIHKN